MSTKTQYFPLGGGLDIVSPAVSLNPGRSLFMLNYEPWHEGGYRRCAGYERYDGRPKPSDATYTAMVIDDTTGINVGDTITGDTSTETGEVAYIDATNNIIVLTMTSGTFSDGENLNSGSYTIQELWTEGEVSEGYNTYYHEQNDIYRNAAADRYRADIGTVTGSGAVLGIWRRGSTVYAVRDNAGDTAGILFKATASGWSTSGITMADYIYFDAGTSSGPFEEGDTVTGATSSASATVHRVVLHSGSWSNNDAYGYLVLTSVSGGPFQNNENLQVSATTIGVADGANTTFAFSNDGDYRFINHNFKASSSTYRTYGVNGVDPAFEIDENHVVSPILFPATALDDQPASNAPFMLEIHRNYLFLAYPGGSLQHSVIGEPLNFNGFLGAAEFGMGDEITGLVSVTGGVMAIYTERMSHGLYGKDTSDWDLKLLSEHSGAILNSAQKLDTIYAYSPIGVTSLARTDVYGDFVGATVSQLIQPLVNDLRTSFTDSTIVRESNQYRIYFSTGAVIVMHVPEAGAYNQNINMQTRKGVEFGFLLYDTKPPSRIYNCEDENGVERIYFASGTDGYVYEDSIGTSFDGETIASTIRLPFNHFGMPAYRKLFRRADIEISTDSVLQFDFESFIDYCLDGSTQSSSDYTKLDCVLAEFGETEYFYGVDPPAVVTNEYWYRQVFQSGFPGTVRAELRGTGQNLSLTISHSSELVNPFTLSGITFHYSPRRQIR